MVQKPDLTPETIGDLNLAYARNYRLLTDTRILLRGIKNLGRKDPESELKP
jgi:hypothetical protein